jgi:hypothetical protein
LLSQSSGQLSSLKHSLSKKHHRSKSTVPGQDIDIKPEKLSASAMSIHKTSGLDIELDANFPAFATKSECILPVSNSSNSIGEEKAQLCRSNTRVDRSNTGSSFYKLTRRDSIKSMLERKSSVVSFVTRIFAHSKDEEKLIQMKVQILHVLLDYIQDHGVNVDGIYRVQAPRNSIEGVFKIMQGKSFSTFADLENFDMHAIANALRIWIKYDPTFIIPEGISKQFLILCGKPLNVTLEHNPPDLIIKARELFNMAPQISYDCLHHLATHLNTIYLNESVNFMNLDTLTAIWALNLFANIPCTSKAAKLAASILIKNPKDVLCRPTEYEKYRSFPELGSPKSPRSFRRPPPSPRQSSDNLQKIYTDIPKSVSADEGFKSCSLPSIENESEPKPSLDSQELSAINTSLIKSASSEEIFVTVKKPQISIKSSSSDSAEYGLASKSEMMVPKGIEVLEFVPASIVQKEVSLNNIIQDSHSVTFNADTKLNNNEEKESFTTEILKGFEKLKNMKKTDDEFENEINKIQSLVMVNIKKLLLQIEDLTTPKNVNEANN